MIVLTFRTLFYDIRYFLSNTQNVRTVGWLVRWLYLKAYQPLLIIQCQIFIKHTHTHTHIYIYIYIYIYMLALLFRRKKNLFFLVRL